MQVMLRTECLCRQVVHRENTWQGESKVGLNSQSVCCSHIVCVLAEGGE